MTKITITIDRDDTVRRAKTPADLARKLGWKP